MAARDRIKRKSAASRPIADLNYHRVLQAQDRVIGKLLDRVEETLTPEEETEALRRFYKAFRLAASDRNFSNLSQAENIELNVWLLYRFRDSQGRSMLQRVVSQVEPDDELQQAVLNALKGSYHALYEVRGVDPDHGIRVQDVFNPGKETFVQAVAESRVVAGGDMIFARVFEVGGCGFISGPSLTYRDAIMKEALKKTIAGMYRQYRSRHKKASYREFFKTEEEEIARIEYFLRRKIQQAFAGKSGTPNLERPALDIPNTEKGVRKFNRGYYENWLQQPLPILQGATPLSAAATPQGRLLVGEFLAKLEKVHSGSTYLQPVFKRIRRRLKIENPGPLGCGPSATTPPSC